MIAAVGEGQKHELFDWTRTMTARQVHAGDQSRFRMASIHCFRGRWCTHSTEAMREFSSIQTARKEANHHNANLTAFDFVQNLMISLSDAAFR
jgi:hypothetical protein